MCHLLCVCQSVRDECLDSGHQLMQHDTVVDVVGVPGWHTRHMTSVHSSDTTGQLSYSSVQSLGQLRTLYISPLADLSNRTPPQLLRDALSHAAFMCDEYSYKDICHAHSQPSELIQKLPVVRQGSIRLEPGFSQLRVQCTRYLSGFWSRWWNTRLCESGVFCLVRVPGMFDLLNESGILYLTSEGGGLDLLSEGGGLTYVVRVGTWPT